MIIFCDETYNVLMHAEHIPKDTKVYFKSLGICHYCDRQLNFEPRSGSRFTVEHIKPKSKGGKDTIDNLTAACVRCNSLRGNAPYEWFLWFLEHYDPRRLPEHGTDEGNKLRNQIRNIFTKGCSRSKKRIRMPYRHGGQDGLHTAKTNAEELQDLHQLRPGAHAPISIRAGGQSERKHAVQVEGRKDAVRGHSLGQVVAPRSQAVLAQWSNHRQQRLVQRLQRQERMWN